MRGSRAGLRTNVPHFVYRCYGADGRLLYVGCSNSVVSRLEGHKSNAWWWPEVVKVRNLVFPDRETGLAREKEAIYSERPRCNVKSRWYKHDPREDWTAQDYIEFHETIINTAAGHFGVHTSKLLADVEREVNDRHGVLIPRTWKPRWVA